MNITAFFESQWVLTRTLSTTLCITMAWTPFGLSWADAMQNAGSQGQQAGQQIVGGFQFPQDSGSGVMTLNPGTGQQSFINVSTLFPDSGNTNSTTANINSLYGNDTSTLAAGLDAQTTLATENSATGSAYQTLINNTHQSHPDLQNDPIWTTSDQILANFTPWAQSFSDCTTTTTQTATTQTVQVPNYQLCVREPTIPQSCTATHQVNVEPLMTYVSGNGGISS